MYRLISFDLDREDGNIGGNYELPEVLPVPFRASRIEVWAVGHAFRTKIDFTGADVTLEKMVEEEIRAA
jgi:hypothetical protein